MDCEICNIRFYYFGSNEKSLTKIEVPNNGYLKADRIKHYEDIYGPLYSVKYRGKTILA